MENRRFTGWPEEAFDLLLQLEGDPPRSLRESLRRDRHRLVRQPMIELLSDVADADPTYEDFSVWGFGKTGWGWKQQSSAVRIERGIELSVRFDLDGLSVFGNGWFVDPRMVQHYRRAVADDGTGPELTTILGELAGQGFSVSGQTLQRGPRGYPRDHPRADLLRHRSLALHRPLGAGAWIHSGEAVDHVLAGFAQLRPLMEWLSDNVGSGAIEGPP
jgi:Conserved hypothetical protein (DUF2461)